MKAAIAVLAGAVLASCQAPTEIRVAITTDFTCADLKGVTVTVGTLGDALESAPPTSTSADCSAGTVGSLVVVPSGSDRAHVGIKVVGGFGAKQAEACVPLPGSSPPDYGPGCIVARRALDYTPQTALTVPIVLRASCNGIVCGETQTCVEGTCTSASVPDPGQCTGAGCGESVLSDAGAPDSGVTTSGCGDTSGLQPGAAWPMSGYCPSGQSRSLHLGPHTTPTQTWAVGANFGGRPAIAADGTVYAIDDDLVAVDPSGKVKWTYATAGQADPAIGADGTVYAENTTSVLAIGPDGAKRWAAAIDAANGGALVIGGDGTIYAGGTSVVVALDPAGHQKWSLGAVGGQMVPVVLSPDGATLYAGTGDNIVLSIAAKTGIQNWSFTTPGVVGGLALGGGAIYASSWGGVLTALTPAGAKAWSYTAPQATMAAYLGAPAVAADGTVYFSVQATLVALDPHGKVLWTFAADEAGQSGAESFAPAVGADGTLYFGASDAAGSQATYGVDATGKKLWSEGAASTDVGELSIGFDGQLIVAGGALFAIGP